MGCCTRILQHAEVVEWYNDWFSFLSHLLAHKGQDSSEIGRYDQSGQPFPTLRYLIKIIELGFLPTLPFLEDLGSWYDPYQLRERIRQHTELDDGPIGSLPITK